MKYIIAKIPLPSNIKHEVEAESIEEVQKWVLKNVDTRCGWVVYEKGDHIPSPIMQWSVNNSFGNPDIFENDNRAKSKIFNYIFKRPTWFDTKEEAEADYESYKEKANYLLDKAEEIEDEVRNCRAEANYELYSSNDNTGYNCQCKDYIRIEIAGYEYRRSYRD